MRKRLKVAAVLVLTAIAIALTLIFHLVLFTSIVFTHFFYIPVILAAFWFGYRGMVVPLVLSLVLVATDLMTGSMSTLLDDLVRSGVFTAVALVVAFIRASAQRTLWSLSEAEQRYRTVADFTYGWEYWEAPDGKIRYVSPSCEEMTGYTAQEFMDRPSLLSEIVLAEDRQAWAGHREECVSITNSDRLHTEFRIMHRDGGVRHIEHFCRMVIDDQGNVLGRRISNNDITKRKEAERTILESESRYRSIVEHISDGLFIHDLRGNILDCNEAACRMVGYSREELLGMNLAMINASEDEQLIQERMALLLELGNIGFDAEHIRKDGSRSSASIIARLVSVEGGGKVQSIVRDIGWRKQAEEEILRSHDALAEAQRIAHMGSWVWNIEENSLTWSDEVYRIFRKNPQEFTPTFVDYVDLLAPWDREKVEKAVQAALKNIRPIDMDNRIILDDGTSLIVHQMGNAVFDASGKPVRITGTVQDITELKRAEEALRQANAKLNLMNSITRHDMKNVMVALNGYLELSSIAQDDAKRRELLSKAQGSLENMERLIQFGKDYQDIGVHSPQWYDITSVIWKHEKMVAGAGRRLEVETNGLEVYADQMIEKVVYNLIDNSLRYAEGGSKIRFYIIQTGLGLVFVCEDDGSGIPEWDKEKIFLKGVGRNTGLGLFLVREILGITGIEISETGAQGKGARFEMLLPAGAFRLANNCDLGRSLSSKPSVPMS